MSVNVRLCRTTRADVIGEGPAAGQPQSHELTLTVFLHNMNLINLRFLFKCHITELYLISIYTLGATETSCLIVAPVN